jgi:hypothetical protein
MVVAIFCNFNIVAIFLMCKLGLCIAGKDAKEHRACWNFMFCWPCISKYACNETNVMHYLSSVYWVTIPLHVSGLPVAHHQEVATHICGNWHVLYVLVDWRQAWMEWDYSIPFWPASRASSWFHYTQPDGNILVRGDGWIIFKHKEDVR